MDNHFVVFLELWDISRNPDVFNVQTTSMYRSLNRCLHAGTRAIKDDYPAMKVMHTHYLSDASAWARSAAERRDGVYGGSSPTHSVVKAWVKHICMGQEFLERDERAGRPVEVIMEDKVALLEERNEPASLRNKPSSCKETNVTASIRFVPHLPESIIKRFPLSDANRLFCLANDDRSLCKKQPSQAWAWEIIRENNPYIGKFRHKEPFRITDKLNVIVHLFGNTAGYNRPETTQSNTKTQKASPRKSSSLTSTAKYSGKSQLSAVANDIKDIKSSQAQLSTDVAYCRTLLQQHSDSISRHDDKIATCEADIQSLQNAQTELSSNIAVIESKLTTAMNSNAPNRCTSTNDPANLAETLEILRRSHNVLLRGVPEEKDALQLPQYVICVKVLMRPNCTEMHLKQQHPNLVLKTKEFFLLKQNHSSG
nr:unnamed protein product [Callosobruchus analis]